jgi:Na+/H+ antiporter NhaD/arsenite permease-like protein
LPSLLVITANVLLFRLIFRRAISTAAKNNHGPETVQVDRFFLAVSAGLVLTAIGYILVSIYGLPLAYPAAGGALLLLSLGISSRRLKFRWQTSGISWFI